MSSSTVASFRGSLASSQRLWSSSGTQVSSTEMGKALEKLVLDGKVEADEAAAVASVLATSTKLTGRAKELAQDFQAFAKLELAKPTSSAATSEGAFRGTLAAAQREFSSMGQSISSTEMGRALGHLTKDSAVSASELAAVKESLKSTRLTGNAREAAEAFVKKYGAVSDTWNTAAIDAAKSDFEKKYYEGPFTAISLPESSKVDLSKLGTKSHAAADAFVSHLQNDFDVSADDSTVSAYKLTLAGRQVDVVEVEDFNNGFYYFQVTSPEGQVLAQANHGDMGGLQWDL